MEINVHLIKQALLTCFGRKYLKSMNEAENNQTEQDH